MENLKKMSVEELKELSRKALSLAKDLKKELPSYELAIENGIEDCSYRTVANGWVSSYYGTAIIEMENGTKFKALGHSPDGDAASIYSDGYIEFHKL